MLHFSHLYLLFRYCIYKCVEKCICINVPRVCSKFCSHKSPVKQVYKLLPDTDLYHTADNVIRSVYIYHMAVAPRFRQIGLQTSAGYGSLPHSRQCHQFSLHLPHSHTAIPWSNTASMFTTQNQLLYSAKQLTKMLQKSIYVQNKQLYHVTSSGYIYSIAKQQFSSQILQVTNHPYHHTNTVQCVTCYNVVNHFNNHTATM